MTEAIITGFLLGMALVFSVGPVIFNIIKIRVNYGIASAFYFIAGVWISDIIWVVMANFFGSMLTQLLLYKKIIGIAGGSFMIGLGMFNIFLKKFNRANESENTIQITGSTNIKLFITGFLINTLNPSVIALWLAAGTKAVSNTLGERLVIFITCLGLNIAADIVKIYLGGKLRNKLTANYVQKLNIISGILFLVFGVLLIFEVFYNGNT